MSLRDPEPLPAIILMRVVNPRAPRTGEQGWIVDAPLDREDDTIPVITLQFERGGDRFRYAYDELEMVMM